MYIYIYIHTYIYILYIYMDISLLQNRLLVNRNKNVLRGGVSFLNQTTTWSNQRANVPLGFESVRERMRQEELGPVREGKMVSMWRWIRYVTQMRNGHVLTPFQQGCGQKWKGYHCEIPPQNCGDRAEDKRMLWGTVGCNQQWFSLDVVLAEAFGMDLQILLAFCTNSIPLILNVDSPY
jgi:hypothetical protein